MPKSEALPPSALEALRSVNFDWTRQLKSVWTDPPYHVPNINDRAADDIMNYFRLRTTRVRWFRRRELISNWGV
jgi:hypothetical protein